MYAIIKNFGEVDKNKGEKIRITHELYREKTHLLDARVLCGGETTRKGLSLQPATWVKLIPELVKALREMGHNIEVQGGK
ncbi:hypothetical protein [Geobacter pickeringii]|uniref:Transcriptional coactivator p15 (PC4) C-terminal domain-containing protein n=1 Tax=Geobacter pickeringii TaxID=345632 RepID=A0A0B5BD71_9BACT|nr:hypothetical protein [Geobacter pickeringii]AJE04673.1 hypothetical protein GPICK_16010 [Geobacter pickeringii]